MKGEQPKLKCTRSSQPAAGQSAPMSPRSGGALLLLALLALAGAPVGGQPHQTHRHQQHQIQAPQVAQLPPAHRANESVPVPVPASTNQPHPNQRRAAPVPAHLANASGADERPRAKAQLVDPEEPQPSLHFGAKVALSLLAATLTLVAVATYADLSESNGTAASADKGAGRGHHHHHRLNHQHHFHQHPHEQHLQQQQQLQRSHRSPSLSSSNSSTSIALSSAPILAGAKTRRQATRGEPSTWFAGYRTGGHYARNLRHLASAQVQSTKAAESPSLSQLLTWSVARQLLIAFSLRHSAALIFQRGPNEHQPTESSPLSDCCCCCCDETTNSPALMRKSRSNTTLGHRSRLSSLSSIDEQKRREQQEALEELEALNGPATTDEPHHFHHLHKSTEATSSEFADSETSLVTAEAPGSTPAAADRRPTTNHWRQEQNAATSTSIDSLHGLRFLSMIWIIAIHSYSFALRWLFFAQSAQLDNLYKTSASQLLANGTFACDSFFFAGGFLLPYLAFPPGRSPPVCERRTSAKTAELRTPSPSAASTDSASLQEAARPAPGKQDNRLQHQHHHQQQQLEEELLATSSPDGTCCAERPTPTINSKPVAGHEPHTNRAPENEFGLGRLLANLLHRYIRMMPLMMAIIGLGANLLRYLGEGPQWEASTVMFDKWCRENWWTNLLFLHNFVKREQMCLSHSWYSAVDLQLFLVGQLLLLALSRSRRWGLAALGVLLLGAQLLTMLLTLWHRLPAVPLIASVSEHTMNLYYGAIYIKPYCRASPYLVGMLLAYLMRTTRLGRVRLTQLQTALGWLISLATLAAILMAMQPAMNGQPPGQLASALYSSLSRPLWACATGWIIFASMTGHGGPLGALLGARCFVPLSRLTYPAYLIHPIVMAAFYGSRQASFHFSHYLMLYLTLGNIVITYASAFLLSALFELPLLTLERTLKRQWRQLKLSHHRRQHQPLRPSQQQDTCSS